MFKIIMCVDSQGGISKNGNLPWNIPGELEYFKKTTITQIVIMGKNTFNSLPNPLPNRTNIVITSSKIPDIMTFETLDEALEYCRNLNKEIYVIGGKRLYDYSINHPLLKEILITKINYNYDCDLRIELPKSNPVIEMSIINRKELDDKKNNIRVECEFIRYTYHLQGEISYLDLLRRVINSPPRETRNGTCYSLFGEHMKFDLKRYPLLTTKQMAYRVIREELLFFLRGDTNNKHLKEKNVNIWTANTTREFIQQNNLPYEEDDMGPMYGFQWRHFGEQYKTCLDIYGGYDQIEYVLNLLRTDPTSRRIIMTTYNPVDAQKSVLYPCHGCTVQFYVDMEDGVNKLSCHMYQRSADIFLGLPFNIASYALLVSIFAKEVNMVPNMLYISIGDVHLYSSHIEQAKVQLSRLPYVGPYLDSNFELCEYKYHSKITASMVA